jgi:two-component system cell cycle sensor histidine kinase/response regulator CckA
MPDTAQLIEELETLRARVASLERAEAALRASEARYRRLFEDSPMALWEEDGSAVKQKIDGWRAAGVPDLRAYLEEHPEAVVECVHALNVIDVSGASLALFRAQDREELLRRLDTVFTEEAFAVFRDEIVAFASGQTRFEDETILQTLTGEKRWVVISTSIAPGCEETWARVFVSIVDVTESRRAERAAQQVRQQLQDMFDNTPVVVYAKDMAGRYIFVNRAWRERTGVFDQDVLGLTDQVNFGVSELWQPNEQEVLAADHAITAEEIGRRTQSTYLATKFLLHDENGTPYALCNISIDITERKWAEEAAQRARQQLSDILYHTPAVVYAKDMQGRFILANRKWREKTGYSEAEIVGKTGHDLFPALWGPDEKWFPYEKEVIETGRAITHEEIGRTTGSVYLATKFLLRDAGGDPYALCDISVDITERKQVETEREALLAQIQAQAQQVQQIVSSVPEGVILLNADKKVILANPVAENDLMALAEARVGETLSHLGNRSLDELLASPPKGFWHEVTSPAHRIFEVIARPIETSLAPGGWVMVLRDVTQERMIQQSIQRQERLAAVGQLAAGIAHDFNNIIAVIVLYAQIIRQTTVLPPKAQEKLLIIAEQAHRATALIEQVLDFSRRSVLERRPMDILLFLKEQVKLLRRTLPENIKVELGYAPAESYVANADPTRIQQTIMNLVVNARDAMPDGGELRIDLDHICVEPGNAPLPEMASGDWIQLRISDTGTGIPPEDLPHVFEPFFTTKPPGQGTGLGLAQVYGIVRQHDGYIDLQSRPGEGTTFTLYFPFGAGPADTPPPDADALTRGSGETILVVEDDAAIRSALSASLELLNYRVLTARDGQEALALWEASRETIAMVLSDVVMPRMGGIALFHALKQRDPSVKVMLLTGHMMEQHLEDQLKILKASGLADWMQKPPALSTLADAIARILRP